MPGHVFIIRGDLTKLFCDAWLMPTDYHLDVRPQWRKIPPLSDQWEPGTATEAWKNRQTRVMKVTDWPKGIPKPWLVNTGGSSITDPEWYAQGVREFVETVTPDLKMLENRITNRCKPLLGIPLVGAGAGGAYERAGDVLHMLLKTLHEVSAQHDVDVALTVKSGPAYAAAMNARNYLLLSGSIAWPEDFHDGLKATASRLAEYIRNGDLVLFLGSGVSAGANLPTWDGLLRQLAEKAGVFDCFDADRKQAKDDFKGLPPLDQARLIADQFEERKLDMGEEIAKVFSGHRHYALAHALLASLEVNEVVTTNYDTLFEQASTYARDQEPRVLPYDPAQAGSRWILKLHGCITQPQDIVLTRLDYLRYDERRAALKGIVQAMLMMRHMLFVGFSLKDENFERIVDDVRKAIRGNGGQQDEAQERPFATALMRRTNYFLQKLWEKDVQWVDFQRTENPAEAARLQEIFLDHLASISVSATAHLMDRHYDGVLTEGEKSLRVALEGMVQGIGDDTRNTPAWRDVEALLARFGSKAQPPV